MDTESFIQGSEELTAIFGKWPSFHDAYVDELFLMRGIVEQTAPSLLAKFHIWEMTNEVDAAGYYVLRNHHLTSIMFSDVSNVELRGFNGGNILFDLAIERIADPQGTGNLFSIDLNTSYGLEGSFQCKRIKVVEVIACTSDGVPLT